MAGLFSDRHDTMQRRNVTPLQLGASRVVFFPLKDTFISGPFAESDEATMWPVS